MARDISLVVRYDPDTRTFQIDQDQTDAYLPDGPVWNYETDQAERDHEQMCIRDRGNRAARTLRGSRLPRDPGVLVRAPGPRRRPAGLEGSREGRLRQDGARIVGYGLAPRVPRHGDPAAHVHGSPPVHDGCAPAEPSGPGNRRGGVGEVRGGRHRRATSPGDRRRVGPIRAVSPSGLERRRRA